MNDKNLDIKNEQLIFVCIQQLMQDSADPETINYFRHSSRSLIELLNQPSLFIFALDEDIANKELNVHLFVIDQTKGYEAQHHRTIVEDSYAQSHKWLSKTTGAKYSIYQPDELKLLFDIDFGCHPMIVHHLWSNGRIVGGLCYKKPKDIKDRSNIIAPIIDVLTIQLAQRQKRIELEDQIKTYQQVLDLIPQRVFWKNKQSLYLGANRAFALDAGLECPEELVGKGDSLFFPEEANMYVRDDANTLKTREHLINHEEPQTNKLGEKVWLRTSKRPMVNSRNELIGILGTYDEITELKQIQFELQQAKDKLEERVKERTQDLKSSNEKLEQTLLELRQTQNHLVESEKMAALGNLVAGISHEVNTPLGVSVAAASHIQDNIVALEESYNSGQLTEEHFTHFCSTVRESNSMILNNLSRASKLIKNFKQIAIDQSHDVPRSVKLYDYVKSVIGTLSPVFRNKHIDIKIDIDEKFELAIFPGAFAQVITNFTENAIKHAFPGDNAAGSFCISCYQDSKYIHLNFIDDGVGVPKALQKKIFEPFFTTQRKNGGSGLGLSVVYNIITQQFGGKITCDSTPESGTRFSILVPNQKKS